MVNPGEQAHPVRDTPVAGRWQWSAAGLRDRLSHLPAGHPSAPLRADGARRPAPPDLRALELPLPGDPDADS